MSAVVVERARRRRRRSDAPAAVAFLSPLAIGVLVFIALPTILAFAMSLFDVSITRATFVGLANFRALVHDHLFWGSLTVTAIYVVAFIPGLTILSLALALLVQAPYRGVRLWRTLLLAPNAVSLVAIALVWRYVLADGDGTIAQVSRFFGIASPSWLGDPHLALFTIIAISLWAFMGFYMLVMLGGLNDIPVELYEAARIDGANAPARFWYITLPMLRPTTFFVILMATVIGLTGLQSFDLVYVLTKGGPANATSLTIYYIYQQAFQYGHFGYASAMAAVLAAILFVAAAVLFRFTNAGRFDAEA